MQANWFETYGLWAVLAGALFEGEAVFVAAGYAISQGYLPLTPTVAVAVAGATLGDHFFFVVGRLWGPRVLRRFGRLRPLRARAILLIRRWGRATAFAGRFAYGFRGVVPLTMGTSRFPILTFTLFNGLGSLAFAALYLSLGFFFGEAVEELLGRARGTELYILFAILAAGGVAWAVREWRIFHSDVPPEDVAEPLVDLGPDGVPPGPDAPK